MTPKPRVLTRHLSAILPVGTLVYIHPRSGSPGVLTSIASEFGEVNGEPRVRVSGMGRLCHVSWLSVVLVGEPEFRAQKRRAAAERAGGGAVCGWCWRPLYDHPQDPGEPFLNVLCDLSRVKL